LKLGTGFGKTLIALDLSQRSGQKTLIIVHRQHLMEQYITEIKKFFPGMRIGIIKGQERTIGDITIAMSQTLERMFKNKTLSTYENQFGLVIVDECHEYITKKRLKVIQSFNSRNFYGMSGSPERTDEQDKAITFTFGRVLTDHALPQIPPTIHVVKSNIAIPAREYHLMIEEHVANLERNALICRLAMNQKAEDRKTLILVKRVEHLRRLEKILDDVVEGFIPIYAKMPAKEKTKLFADLRSGEKSFSILAGSYSLLATGSDFPSLDTLLLAGDLRSRVLSKQSVGRIMRLFKGKQDPLVVDIRDRNNPILENQFKERRKLYKKLGWKLIGDYE
jgi:superfamily II DNA or RNA helicase